MPAKEWRYFALHCLPDPLTRERARSCHCHWLEQTPRTSSMDAEHEKCHIAQFLYILPLHKGGKGQKKCQTEDFTLDKDYSKGCSIPRQSLAYFY